MHDRLTAMPVSWTAFLFQCDVPNLPSVLWIACPMFYILGGLTVRRI